MKECPVCGDTFGDDLNFCDVDGIRLDRQKGSVPTSTHNKVWSVLGVGLLVGGLAVSAVAILFLPRSRPTTTIISSEPQTSTSAKPTTQTPQPESLAPLPSEAPASDLPVAAERMPGDLKKKETSTEPATDAHAASAKEAALSAERADKPAVTEPAKATPTTGKPEAATTTKPAAEPHETTAPKPATPDPTKPKAAGSDQTREPDPKKKEEQRKGGFFKAFKKIFGKN